MVTGFADFLMWSEEEDSKITYKHNGLKLDHSRVKKNLGINFIFKSYIKKSLNILPKK